jgi:hypothetical protein
MAAYNKHNVFVFDRCQKTHNLGSDALTYALCAAANAPVATNSILANLTQISYTNLSTRVAGAPTTNSQSSGTYTLLAARPDPDRIGRGGHLPLRRPLQ